MAARLLEPSPSHPKTPYIEYHPLWQTLYRMLKSAHTKFLSGFAESFRELEFESLQLGFCLKCSGFLSATLSRPPTH